MKFMDTLFKRYACPFSLLDEMIQAGRLAAFVAELVKIENDEMMWEFFLHKVYDKSFEDFKRSVTPRRKATQNEIKTTVNDSKSILNGFIPK